MRFATMLLACCLAAHAAPNDFDSSRPFDQQIRVTTTEFDTDIHHIGPELRPVGRPGDQLYLKLSINKNKKTSAITWKLILQAHYAYMWRFYESVSLSGGKLITAVDIGRQVLSCAYGSCSYVEASLAVLDDEDVRKGLAEGLKMRWNARNVGTFETEIPAAYFVAMQTSISGRESIPLAAPIAPTDQAPASAMALTVRQLPDVRACNSEPSVVLLGKGPGFESYTVDCTNGKFVIVRCESGMCRVLK